MPEEPPVPEESCPQGCVRIFNVAKDAADVAWAASDKGPSAALAYATAIGAALTAMNLCLENCPQVQDP